MYQLHGDRNADQILLSLQKGKAHRYHNPTANKQVSNPQRYRNPTANEQVSKAQILMHINNMVWRRVSPRAVGQTPLCGCQNQVQPWVPGQQGQPGILISQVLKARLLRKLPPKSKQLIWYQNPADFRKIFLNINAYLTDFY
jgi:hypothetical protein